MGGVIVKLQIGWSSLCLPARWNEGLQVKRNGSCGFSSKMPDTPPLFH
jgi:hypothetical protein